MNPIDLHNILDGIIIIGVTWVAKFLRSVDVRLTRIETLLKIKNGVEK